jgi:hypothetical protein
MWMIIICFLVLFCIIYVQSRKSDNNTISKFDSKSYMFDPARKNIKMFNKFKR